MKKFIALAVAGLALTACGGPVEENTPALAQTEQEINPSCASGYQPSYYWDCEQICGRNYGNIRHLVCTNAAGDSYDAGRYGSAVCTACY